MAESSKSGSQDGQPIDVNFGFGRRRQITPDFNGVWELPRPEGPSVEQMAVLKALTPEQVSALTMLCDGLSSENEMIRKNYEGAIEQAVATGLPPILAAIGEAVVRTAENPQQQS